MTSFKYPPPHVRVDQEARVVITGENRTANRPMNVYVDQETVRTLSQEAAREGLSFSAYIRVMAILVRDHGTHPVSDFRKCVHEIVETMERRV